MEIKIVDATPDDAGIIAYIQSQTWLCSYANPEMDITQKDIEEKVAQMNQEQTENIAKKIAKKEALNWVAKVNNQIVGFVAVSKQKNKGKIEALHILPEFQGNGVGKKLMEKALDYLKNCQEIILEVVIYNERAKNFYRAFGFEELKTLSGDPIKLPSGKKINKVLMKKN